jgi:hypothetical protein
MPGMTGFSLLQAEPTQGNDSGNFWHGASQGQQNMQPDLLLPNGHAQNGFFDDNMNTFRQANSRSSFSSSRSAWNGDLSSASINGEEMKRFPSQDSMGAHSTRTTNSSYDQSRSMMYPNVSQMTFQMPSASSDGTGRSNSPDNSALYTPTPQMDLQALECHYQGENYGAHPALFHKSSAALSVNPFNGSMLGQSYMYPTGDETFAYSLTQGTTVLQDTVIYHPDSVSEPPNWEDSIDYLDSPTSSPSQEESWEQLPTPELAPSTQTSSDYSPTVEGLAPRYVPDFPDFVELLPHTHFGDRQPRKPVAPRHSKVTSDLSRRPRLNGSEASDESIKAIGRSSVDLDNTARDHPLYHNASPQADGLYHCPWEKETTCQHKPEKLKCNYEYVSTLVHSDNANTLSKFVDSHLKPYRCKVAACKDLHFSSTACLLRHEREAHAMHGHGDKPFLCTYDGCERGASGNGFPRHWNLRDHMKRVHNHNEPGQAKSTASGSPPPSAKGAKKRKAGDDVEKAPKRIATPPVVRPRGPSPVEYYQQKHQALVRAVQSLQDPKNIGNPMLLSEIENSLKVMSETTQRMHNAMDFAQRSG